MGMDMNALDSALVELAAASTALERTSRPNLKDVEEARDKAKKAHGILDAAHKLLSCGIYSVADAPADPGPSLFTPTGGPAVPPPMAPEPVEVVTESAPGEWDAMGDLAREQAFVALLNDLETDAKQENTVTLKAAVTARANWMGYFKTCPLDAWIALWSAYYGRPTAHMGIPYEQELADALASAREGEA